MGPIQYVKHLCSGRRLPFTAAYFGSIALTLYFAVGVSFRPIVCFIYLCFPAILFSMLLSISRSNNLLVLSKQKDIHAPIPIFDTKWRPHLSKEGGPPMTNLASCCATSLPMICVLVFISHVIARRVGGK